MPNLKLTELPTLSPINFTSTDLIYIVDSELNTSNKIPFNLLAGDKLTLLSAYDIENTTNLEFLSTNIQDNTTTISTLNGGLGDVSADVINLSAKIDSNFENLSGIQDTKARQTDVNLISSNILELSGKFSFIDDDVGDSFTNAISLSQGTVSLTASNDDITVLNLGLDTFSSPTFTGLTVDGVNIKPAVVLNTAKNTYPSADATKVGFITVTQAVDLDSLETTAANAIPLATLKTQTAASTDFADFKSRIAAL